MGIKICAGSTVLQGSNGNNVNLSVQNIAGADISGFVCEVLRIFLALDLKSKATALAYLYDLEDGKALPMGAEVSA